MRDHLEMKRNGASKLLSLLQLQFSFCSLKAISSVTRSLLQLQGHYFSYKVITSVTR